MDSSKGCFFLIGLLVSSTIFSSILLSLWAKPVFGEEFTQEQLTASLGTKSADLLIKMVPAIVTTDTLQFGQKPAMSGSNSSMSNSNSSMSPAANSGINATSVSIVKGASNPSTQKPYDPSPLNVAVGRTVLWINSDNTAHTVTREILPVIHPQTDLIPEYLVLDRHSNMLLINQEQSATIVLSIHPCWDKL